MRFLQSSAISFILVKFRLQNFFFKLMLCNLKQIFIQTLYFLNVLKVYGLSYFLIVLSENFSCLLKVLGTCTYFEKESEFVLNKKFKNGSSRLTRKVFGEKMQMIEPIYTEIENNVRMNDGKSLRNRI